MKKPKSFGINRYNDFVKGQNGITLTALVILIVVLIILASISIGMITGDNGIIFKTRKSKSQAIIEDVKEAAEVIKTNYETYNGGSDPTSRYIIEMLIEQGKITPEQVKEYGDETGIGIILVEGEEVEILGALPGFDDMNWDIFAALYDDGTLVLSNNTDAIDYDRVVYDYGNVIDEYNGPEWSGSSEIHKVKVLNTIKPTSMRNWFGYLSELTEIENIENINTTYVTDMSYCFNTIPNITHLDLSSFNTKNVKYMSGMFSGGPDWSQNIQIIDGLENFDTRNVEDMSGMFSYCPNLTRADVSNFDTSKVTNFSCMFLLCQSLEEIDVSNFDTSNVTDFSRMFCECCSVTELDVSNFNTEKATDISRMFASCNNITSIDVSSFNTSKVTNMQMMFSCCYGLTDIDLSNFDMSKVTQYTSYMFDSCTGLKRVYFPDNATIISAQTFARCTSLETVYIPASVVTIDSCSSSSSFSTLSYPFSRCNASLVIYCGAASKPSGWGPYWNSNGNGATLTAKFGYTRAQYEAEVGNN